jgi:putative glycosyl hydrolase-like family 15 (GHL15) protein
MVRRLLISSVLSACAFTSAHAATGSSPTAPIYPLLGGYLTSGSQNVGNATYLANIAKLNMAVLSTWPGFTSDGKTMQEVIEAIKKINPHEVIFLYQNINELPTNPNAVWDADLAAINANHWWLYEKGDSGTKVPSWWGNGYYEVNTTIMYPRNSSDQWYVDWRANWQVTNLANTTPAADGFFTDNVFWAPRVNGDWQQDGASDSDANTTVRQWYRQGYVHFINDLKAKMPGKYQTGNIADWGSTSAVITEYNQVLQGGLMEGMIGESWSLESRGFAVMMAGYKKMMNAIAKPQLVIFEQDGSLTDYQGMRYGLAACLLGNAYYQFNVNESGDAVYWYDEFNANLGAATSAPFPAAAYQKGVYRRDFANGIALVNPKGNGTQTITLETNYKKLSGKQAPSINNGATVRTVTLKDRDGIILMRE